MHACTSHAHPTCKPIHVSVVETKMAEGAFIEVLKSDDVSTAKSMLLSSPLSVDVQDEVPYVTMYAPYTVEPL